MTPAEREVARCKNNIGQGGDPEFWRRRLTRAIAALETELETLRRGLRYTEAPTAKERSA